MNALMKTRQISKVRDWPEPHELDHFVMLPVGDTKIGEEIKAGDLAMIDMSRRDLIDGIYAIHVGVGACFRRVQKLISGEIAMQEPTSEDGYETIICQKEHGLNVIGRVTFVFRKI